MNSKQALCDGGGGFSVGALVFLGGGWGVFCGAESAGSFVLGNRVLSKLNKPKGSMETNLQKYKNFQAKIRKSKAFSIALIDKLIYNRICVSIVGKCTQKEETFFFGPRNRQKSERKSKQIKESLIA